METSAQSKEANHPMRTRWVCAIRRACVLGAFAFTLMALPSGALALTFTTIDVPGALNTQAFGINPAGQIVGDYLDSSFGQHGFLMGEHGTFTTIDVPGARSTAAFGINPAGQIVGSYLDSSSTGHGFVAR